MAYGRRLTSQQDSTRCDLRIASPTPPYIYVFFELPKSQPAGRNRMIRAAKAANLKIAGHKATKPEPRKLRQSNRVRKISPKFSCIKFFQIRDVPTQNPGHPGHSLSKTTQKGTLHKVFVRDIPTSGSRMSQEYPAQKLYV